ncbi:MAG: glycosyltransferase [Burkholderiaceae bacterium]
MPNPERPSYGPLKPHGPAQRHASPGAAPPQGEPHAPLNVLVVVPVYNGGPLWHEAARALARAQAFSRHHVRVEVVDSSSRDESAAVAREHGFPVRSIASRDFDHGGTRNAAVLNQAADIYVFLTQDAVLDHPAALDGLLAAFQDPDVAVAYGRQLPHRDANPIAAHARAFNYGAHSRVVGLRDRSRLGIKTVFVSNSFAAYRAPVFQALGGFPERVILSEDMYLAARAVLDGCKVAYVSEACVRHSHNYSPLEEFRRYFDIGVFQADHGWIGEEFGAAEGEGLRFVKSEARHLLAQAPLWLPRACLHNALKILGYRLGHHYNHLPTTWRQHLSMQPRYWR